MGCSIYGASHFYISSKTKMANPIWKDYYVNLGVDDSTTFRVLEGDTVIYTGIAYKRPGKVSNMIRINDICADFLVAEFPELGKVFVGHELKRFVVEKLVNGVYQYCDDAEFYVDWSYDYKFDPLVKGLNCPINSRVTPLTPVPYSVLHADELETESTKTGGFMYYAPSANNAFGTYLIDMSEFVDGDVVLFAESEVEKVSAYKVVDICVDYALYYRNAYGGVDMLLIEGNHSEADNLTRHIRGIDYDNSNIRNRGTENYVNEISKTLTLHTSWLSDEESSRMHHLLNSTEVYLYDIKKAQMIPVVLTDTQTQYKTYKGNGGNLVNYAINVSIAQERVRR